MQTVRARLSVLVLLLFVAGCKEVVHSGLSEREANEIVAVLYAQGMSATKDTQKGDTYSVVVSKANFGAALAILADAGLPREPFRSIGEIFPGDNMVGTPFEERARYAFALSQELSRTLTEIDGVHFARVHVVIPERQRFQDTVQPSKASLAIYHRPDFDPQAHVAQMKTLASFAIPDLQYDDVSVALFPVGGTNNRVIASPAGVFSAGAATGDVAIRTPSSGNDYAMLLFVLGVLLAVTVLVARMLVRLRSAFGRVFSNGK